MIASAVSRSAVQPLSSSIVRMANGFPLRLFSWRSASNGSPIRTAPKFEVGDERYAWLNDVQAVAHGAGLQIEGEPAVGYDVYALL